MANGSTAGPIDLALPLSPSKLRGDYVAYVLQVMGTAVCLNRSRNREANLCATCVYVTIDRTLRFSPRSGARLQLSVCLLCKRSVVLRPGRGLSKIRLRERETERQGETERRKEGGRECGVFWTGGRGTRHTANSCFLTMKRQLIDYK